MKRLLEKIKKALRISHEHLDDEITDMIEACLLDLNISGVRVINECDPLILQAVKVYCKANAGLNNDDSEKFQRSYNSLKTHLSLCGDYNVHV